MKVFKFICVIIILFSGISAFAQLEMLDLDTGMLSTNVRTEYYDNTEYNSIVKTFHGVVDFTGAEIIPCDYEGSVFIINDLVYIKNSTNNYTIMNLKGVKLLDIVSDSIPVFVNGVALIEKDKKVGCIDINGNFVIPMEYDSIQNYFNNYFCLSKGFLIVIKDGKYGVINLKNQIIMPFEYDKIDTSVTHYQKKDDILRVEKNGKIGYYTINGKELVYPKYSSGNFYTNGLATVNIEGNYTVINTQGIELFPPTNEYEFMYAINSNFIIVMKKDKIGFINIKCEEKSPCVFTLLKSNFEIFKVINKVYTDPNERFEVTRQFFIDSIEKDYSPLMRFYKDNKPCFINQNGEVVFSYNIYDAEKFKENRSVFTVIDSFEVNLDALYDTKGKNISFNNIEDAYEYVKNIPEKDINDMMQRYKDGKYNERLDKNTRYNFRAFIFKSSLDNKKQEIRSSFISPPLVKGCIFRSPCEDSMTVFNKEFGLDIPFGLDTERFYLININAKQGVFGINGSVIIPSKYDKISFFDDGIATFSQNEKSGLINKDNQIILFNNNYNYIGKFSCGLAYFIIINERDFIHGYIDKDGKEVFSNSYDYVTSFTDDKAIVGKMDKKNAENGVIPVKVGVIDKDNNTIVNFEYNQSDLRITKSGAIICKTKEGQAIINNSGFIGSSFYTNIREDDFCPFDDTEYEIIFGVSKPKNKYLIVEKSIK